MPSGGSRKDENRLIRIEHLELLKKRTWFALLKLAKNNLREENHVHQLTVSRLWHSGLPASQHQLLRGQCLVPPGTNPGKVSLPRIRLYAGPWPGNKGALLGHLADRPQTDLP